MKKTSRLDIVRAILRSLVVRRSTSGDEERNRRFWIYLMKIKDSHIDETGFELSYPQELASKHDMTGVESLKVIIKGPSSITLVNQIEHQLTPRCRDSLPKSTTLWKTSSPASSTSPYPGTARPRSSIPGYPEIRSNSRTQTSEQSGNRSYEPQAEA